ncbi:hypothetical protein HC928_01690 [bacterium]|nr:hypothetical protein [bacterium]
MKNVFTDMHDMACFLVLCGYDIHWVYQPLSEIHKVLAALKPANTASNAQESAAANTDDLPAPTSGSNAQAPKTNVFFFFAGHGTVVNSGEYYKFLGNSGKDRTESDQIKINKYWLEKFTSFNVFLCLATCITPSTQRKTDAQDLNGLKKVFQDCTEIVVWASQNDAEANDTGDDRITQKLLSQMREYWLAATVNHQAISVNLSKVQHKILAPVVPKQTEGDIFRTCIYSFIAFNKNRGANVSGKNWRELEDHMILDDSDITRRFWTKYYDYVSPTHPSPELEAKARSISEALKTEDVSKMKALSEEVQTLFNTAQNTDEWVQLKLLHYWLTIVSRSTGYEQAILDIKKLISPTCGEKFKIDKLRKYLPRTFWEHLQDKLGTIAREEPFPKAPTYDAIEYFIGKEWINVIRKLRELIQAAETNKKFVEEFKNLSDKIQAAIDATRVYEQRVTSLQPEVTQLHTRLTALDDPNTAGQRAPARHAPRPAG